MKKIFCIALAAAALGACSSGSQFKVTGKVDGADGKMLYLEASALEGIVPLDSVKLKADGTFSFESSRPASPEFYRLRVDDKVINLAVDSTETLTVTAPYATFATGYQVTGSSDCEKIKQLTLLQAKLQADADRLAEDAQARRIGMDVYQQRLSALLKKYKDEVKINYIFAAPNTTAAYFALYQQIGGRYIFSPFVQEDYPYWAAVATAYHTYMPQYDRSKNIYNFVLDALREKQNTQKQAALSELMNSEQAAGYIDIVLPDRYGNEMRLSDYEGQVVLIDFSAYEAQESIDYTFALRDLYNKYHARGLEIFQISLDRNKLLWESSTENIPWVCVRDDDGPATRYANLYNVTQLPTTFLMDKEGNIIARSLKFGELDKKIGELVK